MLTYKLAGPHKIILIREQLQSLFIEMAHSDLNHIGISQIGNTEIAGQDGFHFTLSFSNIHDHHRQIIGEKK